jgi:putative DNA primase/helicase
MKKPPQTKPSPKAPLTKKNAPHAKATSNNAPDNKDDVKTKHREKIAEEHGSILIIEGEKPKLNPIAFAVLFAETHKVAHRTRDKQFFQFHDKEGIWAPVSSNSLIKQMAATLKELADEFKASELLVKRKSGQMKDLLNLVGACREFGEPSPIYRAFLPVANGVLDVSTDAPVLLPDSPDYWFTEKIPFVYNQKAKCERFLNELIRPALPDPDDVLLLQRDLGRQLFAGNDAQTITILQGEGGSGKSVLISIIEAIISLSKIGYLRSHQLTGRFETHGFIGKSTLVGKDVLPDYLNNQGAAVIKSLTGADRVQTEQKYGGKHDMRGSFYVIITTNSRLTIKLHGDLKAWRRRLVVYAFSRETPDKIIPNFDQVLLKEEGDAIFSWLLQGYLAHRAELGEHGTLKLTETQQKRVDDWLEESDALRVFAKASIQKGMGTITVEELWAAFTEFARERKWKLPRQQNFHEEFKGVMFALFGVDKSTHIKRMGIDARGYDEVLFINQNKVL